MKPYYCIIIFILFVIIFPGMVKGQVAPGKVNAEQLAESVQAVLGVKQPVEWIAKPVSSTIKHSLKDHLKIKRSLPDTLYLGKVQTKQGLRYLIPDIAPSKSEKYSYVLYLNKKKEIVDVDVLEYRENYGYEIDYPFFRKQFQGKENPQSVRFGRSIQNISGATISARSLTYSVHDLLVLMQKIILP